jgi:hypothetical protein
VSRLESRELPAAGTLMMDTARDRVGEFQWVGGGRFHLRPTDGGREWEVTPTCVREATDEERIRARVAAQNARSRGD